MHLSLSPRHDGGESLLRSANGAWSRVGDRDVLLDDSPMIFLVFGVARVFVIPDASWPGASSRSTTKDVFV
jgi:hypothetical protein